LVTQVTVDFSGALNTTLVAESTGAIGWWSRVHDGGLIAELREDICAMSLPREIRTDRLLLRRWCAADREPYAVLNSDPAVMEHFPAVLSREQSDAHATRIAAALEERGFGLWAVEVPGVKSFAGFIGLTRPHFEAHFTPCVEIGWRLCRECWGRGYATEGARAALGFGFRHLGLAEIVSFTVIGNFRSRRVMEKIGMTHRPADDFDHPLLPEGHRLRRHVLYRIPKGDFVA
jgi:RimJ/RimL family protein N-acetyltransferase